MGVHGLAVARLTVVAVCALVAAPATASELRPEAVHAYETYVDAARAAFLAHVHADQQPRSTAPPGPVREGDEPMPQTHGRVIRVPGGTVHHWRGALFVPAIGLDRVLAVAQSYDSYAAIHKPVVASRLIERSGDTYHVFARVREDVGVASVVLDVWSVVTYERAGESVHSLGQSRDIRQVENPNRPQERYLPPGRDAGYLWRANTFQRFVARNGGVWIELETIGLSRSIPKFLVWFVEPIARRVGRASVERTLLEFRRAVVGAAGSAPVSG